MSSGAHDDAYRYYEGRPPYSPKMAARLARELSFNENTRILEIACGNGALSRVLAPHVGHITGLDISVKMLSVAFQDPKIRYVEWDFNRQPPYSDGRFHHIAIGNALHWLSPQKLLDTFNESLEPGASLVVCTSRFDLSGWYLSFRHLLREYGKLGINPSQRAQERLQLIGLRHQGTVTERFQVTMTPGDVLLNALSFQPVTKAIEANLASFKSRLAPLLRPAMSNGHLTATCISSAGAWTR